MKIIKVISERIAEEVNDADTYINLATEWKAEQPEAANVFEELSTQEIRHADMLHEVVVKLIEEYRQTKGEPPAGMMALYDYLHGQNIENAMRVKVKQKMYEEAA